MKVKARSSLSISHDPDKLEPRLYADRRSYVFAGVVIHSADELHAGVIVFFESKYTCSFLRDH